MEQGKQKNGISPKKNALLQNLRFPGYNRVTLRLWNPVKGGTKCHFEKSDTFFQKTKNKCQKKSDAFFQQIKKFGSDLRLHRLRAAGRHCGVDPGVLITSQHDTSIAQKNSRKKKKNFLNQKKKNVTHLVGKSTDFSY